MLLTRDEIIERANSIGVTIHHPDWVISSVVPDEEAANYLRDQQDFTDTKHHGRYQIMDDLGISGLLNLLGLDTHEEEEQQMLDALSSYEGWELYEPPNDYERDEEHDNRVRVIAFWYRN